MKKILLVDDEVLFTDFLTERLKDNALDVSSAYSLKKAFEVTNEQYFDVIVTDNRVDGPVPSVLHDGVSLIKDLKARKRVGKAVLISGVEPLDKPGTDLFLEKPINTDYLKEWIFMNG